MNLTLVLSLFATTGAGLYGWYCEESRDDCTTNDCEQRLDVSVRLGERPRPAMEPDARVHGSADASPTYWTLPGTGLR